MDSIFVVGDGYVNCNVGDCVEVLLLVGAKVGAGVFIIIMVVVVVVVVVVVAVVSLPRANRPKAKHTKMTLSKHTLA